MDDLYSYIKTVYKNPKPVIKNNLRRPDVFEYLFDHNPKIKLWNKKFDLLKIPFFFFSKIKLDSLFKNKLDDMFVKYIIPVKKYVAQIIKEGWKWNYISIKDYNLIVLFSDFCNKFETIERSNELNESDFFKMEESFLKITKYREYIEIIQQSIEKMLKANKLLDDKQIKELLINLEFIFSFKDLYPSIYDLIIGFNIYYFKRYLDWKDIVMEEVTEIVQTGFYDCSLDIFEEIVKNIKKIIDTIEELKKEKKYLDWLKDLCKIDNNFKPNKIASFYEIIKREWASDGQDIFTLIINLTDNFNIKFRTLLFEEFDVMSTNENIIKLKIIDKAPLEPIYQKLENNLFHLKAKHSGNLSQKVSFNDFILSEYPQNLFDDTQKVLYEKIEDILYNFRELGLKLHSMLESDSFIIKNKDRNKFMIVKPVDWRGKSVFDVLNFFIELSLQICGVFKEKNIQEELRKLSSIIELLENNQNRLNSISDANHIIETIMREEKKTNE
ncbi:MAG: hypothetical protein A2086_16980 [Spirochaetes bacterium GWD1_27_9]|nr:MAG: hypothetical protein A2Z98_18250 [Spirochaetes bacterium GWB1_27_13]OHD27036.1 MAG: hypothetical protein A2Y34_18380 [Spirochaetes bacterium GWC1_27_15]OHD29447.1 MAG: hypothetical protein A2086_16980 [Spirochaetes bacterium GWD1_27_9]